MGQMLIMGRGQCEWIAMIFEYDSDKDAKNFKKHKLHLKVAEEFIEFDENPYIEYENDNKTTRNGIKGYFGGMIIIYSYHIL